MTNVSLGNHAAVRVPLAERENIRKFYCDVLGAKLIRELSWKDDIRLGAGFYFAFVYDADGDESEFLRTGKSVWLEIKATNVDEMRKKIVDSGVRVLDIPDPHLYFQAPGGQVLRLVGSDEDLSDYDGDSSPVA